MKQLSFIIATFGIVIVSHAQTKADEDAIRAIPSSMCDAWAKHDAHQMAKFMAEDVDFITVGATWFHGRSDYEKISHPSAQRPLQGIEEHGARDDGSISAPGSRLASF